MKTKPIQTLLLLLSFAASGLAAQGINTFSSEVTGHGPAMILIPGLACDGSVWDETVARYQSDYECHVVSLAGFGAHSPGPPNDELLATVRDELATYIRERGLESPVVVGHSLGGFIALWLAAEEPALVGKIVTVDSLPFLPAAMDPNATAQSARATAEQRRTAMRNGSQNDDSLRMMLGTMVTNPADLEKALAMSRQSDPSTVAQAMFELSTTDLRDAVAAIESPTLALGAWIAYQQYGATRESTAAIFDSQYVKHPNYILAMSDRGKHFIMWDDPDFFYAQLDAFLGR